MARFIVEIDTDLTAQQLRTVLRGNAKEDLDKYKIKIVKEVSIEPVTTYGTVADLRKDEQTKYTTLNTTQRRKAVQEFVFFKAQGTFQGSKPHPSSPYQTAVPFYSNAVLGRQVFPGDTTLDQLHQMLSKSLNDHSNKTGELGDWRITHAKQYGGFWTYRYEKYIRIKLGSGPARNQILESKAAESQ